MEKIIQEIFKSILEGDSHRIDIHVNEAIEKGINPSVILNDGMVAAMGKVGKLFEEGEYFVPEMLISARAMQKGMKLLKPYLVKDGISSRGKVVIGTVKGDLHDIGKNLVMMMLEGAAFDVIDLGTDVSPEKFVESVTSEKPDIIALSALLTTTMQNMQATIELLEKVGLREKVKVIGGGAPVTEQYARVIKADGYSADASRAVGLSKSLMQYVNRTEM